MLCGSPVLAEDVARELDAPGNLRDRTQRVRAELHRLNAFTEVRRGRWTLGFPSGYQATPLPTIEIAEYFEQVHKDTMQPQLARKIRLNAIRTGKPTAATT